MNPGYLACSGWVASAVGVAAQLGIADLLAEGARTSGDLAGATGMKEMPLRRVLHLLAAMDVFAEGPDGTFANTKDSEALRADHPHSVRAWCMLACGDYQRIFQGMAHTVRTGEPATPAVLGSALYPYLTGHPEAADIYDRAMEDVARPLAGVVVQSRDFSSVRTVVDIGGGRGTIVRGLLRALPHLTGVCFDRPDVCERAARDVEPALHGRLSYVGGDFFASVPPGADIYILKNVLHNWNDERGVALLRAVAAAMQGAAQSRLLIIEPVIGGGMPGLYRALDDLLQIVICEPGATPRSREDLSALATGAGYAVAEPRALSSGHMLIECAVRP